jgi:hypothetical protein
MPCLGLVRANAVIGQQLQLEGAAACRRGLGALAAEKQLSGVAHGLSPAAKLRGLALKVVLEGGAGRRGACRLAFDRAQHLAAVVVLGG